MTDTELSSHGWVTPRKDGAYARCGGPAMCSVCAKEKAAKELYLKNSISPPSGKDDND